MLSSLLPGLGKCQRRAQIGSSKAITLRPIEFAEVLAIALSREHAPVTDDPIVYDLHSAVMKSENVLQIL